MLQDETPPGDVQPESEDLLRSANRGGRVWMCGGPILTQVADVFSELLERGVQAFRVAGDFQGVHHEGHAVDLLAQARPLHVADSLRRVHGLVRAELIEEEERRTGCYRGNGS